MISRITSLHRPGTRTTLFRATIPISSLTHRYFATNEKFWVTNPNERVDIRMSEEGIGAKPAKTFIDVFRTTVQKHGHLDAVKCKEIIDGELTGQWKTWTWQDYWNDSISFAKSLIALNINMFKIINIIGFNSVSISVLIFS
jgi:hypothetical protein